MNDSIEPLAPPAADAAHPAGSAIERAAVPPGRAVYAYPAPCDTRAAPQVVPQIVMCALILTCAQIAINERPGGTERAAGAIRAEQRAKSSEI